MRRFNDSPRNCADPAFHNPLRDAKHPGLVRERQRKQRSSLKRSSESDRPVRIPTARKLWLRPKRIAQIPAPQAQRIGSMVEYHIYQRGRLRVPIAIFRYDRYLRVIRGL